MRLLPLILFGSTMSLGGAMSAFAQQPAAEPPVGNVVLQAQGEGAQVYACTNAKWTLKAPDARLLDSSGDVIGKHFAGPTWQRSEERRVGKEC